MERLVALGTVNSGLGGGGGGGVAGVVRLFGGIKQ